MGKFIGTVHSTQRKCKPEINPTNNFQKMLNFKITK